MAQAVAESAIETNHVRILRIRIVRKIHGESDQILRVEARIAPQQSVKAFDRESRADEHHQRKRCHEKSAWLIPTPSMLR